MIDRCDIIANFGEMAEWSKARDSKSRIRQRIQGSNPCLSANEKPPERAVFHWRRDRLFRDLSGFDYGESSGLPVDARPKGRAVPRSGMAGSPEGEPDTIPVGGRNGDKPPGDIGTDRT